MKGVANIMRLLISTNQRSVGVHSDIITQIKWKESRRGLVGSVLAY